MTDKSISASTIIDAPPATVFAILADPRQHSRIDGSGSVGAVIEAPERLSAKGDKFTVHMKLFGVPYKIENKVVEFEPDRRIAWRHFGAHRWRYEMAPTDDGGTTVTETFDYSRYNAVGARLIELTGFPERNRHGIEQTLARLKQAAETDATATP
ncbi:MAG TPA: SRPBCC family protein [Nocardioidaceae bacterium]|nr:SRPBCC family protein [Nocardioidaceae bacterium]